MLPAGVLSLCLPTARSSSRIASVGPLHRAPGAARLGASYSRPVLVHLCGVRGSIPTSGREFIEVGGSTSCVAIAHDGAAPTLLLDAGTGLVNVTSLLGGRPFLARSCSATCTGTT